MIKDFGGKVPVIDESAFVAPNSSIIGEVVIGPESSVWFGAVIRGDRSRIRIGARTSVQDNCVLHSDPDDDVFLGDDVTVGHGAVLHGCRIGNNVIVGMNATVLNGAEIGDNSIVGAGAVVSQGKKFPAGSVILGVPARVVKDVSESDVEMIKRAAEVYVGLAGEYRKMRE